MTSPITQGPLPHSPAGTIPAPPRVTPRGLALVHRWPRKTLQGPVTTPLTRVHGKAPRAAGPEVVLGFHGAQAICLNLAATTRAERQELLAAFLEAERNAAALHREVPA